MASLNIVCIYDYLNLELQLEQRSASHASLNRSNGFYSLGLDLHECVDS